jgi:hypothetical protein
VWVIPIRRSLFLNCRHRKRKHHQSEEIVQRVATHVSIEPPFRDLLANVFVKRFMAMETRTFVEPLGTIKVS